MPRRKVTRVFLEEYRQNSVAPESAVDRIEVRRAKALAEALGSLAKTRIRISRLADPGHKCIPQRKRMDRPNSYTPGEISVSARDFGTFAELSTVLKFGHHPHNALVLFLLEHLV